MHVSRNTSEMWGASIRASLRGAIAAPHRRTFFDNQTEANAEAKRIASVAVFMQRGAFFLAIVGTTHDRFQQNEPKRIVDRAGESAARAAANVPGANEPKASAVPRDVSDDQAKRCAVIAAISDITKSQKRTQR